MALTGGFNASQTVVAGTGHIYIADVGEDFPDDLETPEDGWHDLGYTTEDGLTFNYNPTVQELRAWQSFYPIRRIVTEIEAIMSFTLMQVEDLEAFKLAFGGGVEAETGVDSDVFEYTPPPPGELYERALIADVIDGDRMFRFRVPKGMNGAQAQVQFVRTDAANLPVEFGVLGESEEVAPWTRLRGAVPELPPE